MAEFCNCLGHEERCTRKTKLNKLSAIPLDPPDEHLRVLIKKGTVSVETSLKELEENYASKSEWKVIEDGGVLSIPLEEFRMINLPKPDHKGSVGFGKKKEGGKQIDGYPVAQTVTNLTEEVLIKYSEERERARAAGKSEADAERSAQAAARNLSVMTAVQRWQDNDAEIKLKRAIEKITIDQKIPALILRSINLKALSALKDLGLKLSEDAEIDLMMAYASGNSLHVVVFEVKRADTYPWQTKCPIPTKQSVNKAENQLTKDLDVLMAILAGIPSSLIVVHTLACFPDSSLSELETIFCPNCLETSIIGQEDVADMSLLQKKTQVAAKVEVGTTYGMHLLLTLAARCLSHQSLLHMGYREVKDKERLVTERHRYNLESVDRKMKQREFVVASPQQQQVIADFTISSIKRHLVLEGPAGTGKTLLALQVAINLLESINGAAEEDKGPVLVVTNGFILNTDDPLMHHLDISTASAATKIFLDWDDIMAEFGLVRSWDGMELIHLTEALAKKWNGQQIVMLVDEITNKEMLNEVGEESIPSTVRMILVRNPRTYDGPLTLPPSFLHVTLTTTYRSTISITKFTRFIGKFKDHLVIPEGDFGSDVEGHKPIVFDIGRKRKMEIALKHCRKNLGDDATILFEYGLPTASFEAIVKEQGKMLGGPWDCYEASRYFGWEAERVVAVTDGTALLEMATRAKTHLAIILVEGSDYQDTRKWCQEAHRQGLIEKYHKYDE